MCAFKWILAQITIRDGFLYIDHIDAHRKAQMKEKMSGSNQAELFCLTTIDMQLHQYSSEN